MSALYTISCLRRRIRELRAAIIALDGTPPSSCFIRLMPGAPTAPVIRRLRCRIGNLTAILAGINPGEGISADSTDITADQTDITADAT